MCKCIKKQETHGLVGFEEEGRRRWRPGSGEGAQVDRKVRMSSVLT